MTKKYYGDFENFTKCWICDNVYVDADVKVIIVISLENIEAMHMEIIITRLN